MSAFITRRRIGICFVFFQTCNSSPRRPSGGVATKRTRSSAISCDGVTNDRKVSRKADMYDRSTNRSKVSLSTSFSSVAARTSCRTFLIGDHCEKVKGCNGVSNKG